jgi:glycerol-3-phosphate dehydrogenase
MSAKSSNSERVVIVGGGIAGLAVAARLAQSGRPVTVFEQGPLGSGASTRNQGWLHSGGLYAAEQPALARLCYESLRETLAFSPECVEPGHSGAIFLLSDARADRWLRAWRQVGIPHTPLPPAQVLERVPFLTAAEIHNAFLLPDRSIRADALLRQLAETAQTAGAEIRANTRVARLLRVRDEVRGVATALGDEVTGALVVLANNAAGLLPELGPCAKPSPCVADGCAVISLKTHLIAVDPGPTSWPICLPEAEGFSHLPHPPKSVFGADRWLRADGAGDTVVVPGELERLREQVATLFPGFAAAACEAAAWAGTTIQVVPPGRELPTSVAWPGVIDHAEEPSAVGGVISVFPGRATLWGRLADETLRIVSAKVGDTELPVASPPWAVPSDEATSSCESVDVFHCQKCGSVRRHRQVRRPPVCCGGVMVKAAVEAFPAALPSEDEPSTRNAASEHLLTKDTV